MDFVVSGVTKKELAELRRMLVRSDYYDEQEARDASDADVLSAAIQYLDFGGYGSVNLSDIDVRKLRG